MNNHLNKQENSSYLGITFDIIWLGINVDHIVFDVVTDVLHKLKEVLVHSIVVQYLEALNFRADLSYKRSTEYKHALWMVTLRSCY